MRTKLAHWQSSGIGGSASSARASGVGILAREREEHRLVDGEREDQLELVAVLVAEELALLLRRQVDLAEQHRLAVAPPDEAAQVAQQLVRVLPRAPPVPGGSIRNGTASTRNPLSPCSSQKPATWAISSRTSGLATFRSGWWE